MKLETKVAMRIEAVRMVYESKFIPEWELVLAPVHNYNGGYTYSREKYAPITVVPLANEDEARAFGARLGEVLPGSEVLKRKT